MYVPCHTFTGKKNVKFSSCIRLLKSMVLNMVSSGGPGLVGKSSHRKISRTIWAVRGNIALITLYNRSEQKSNSACLNVEMDGLQQEKTTLGSTFYQQGNIWFYQQGFSTHRTVFHPLDTALKTIIFKKKKI